MVGGVAKTPHGVDKATAGVYTNVRVLRFHNGCTKRKSVYNYVYCNTTQKGNAMQTNCKAIAKIVVNKKLQTLRLLVTFDIYAKSVTVRNAAYVSGDICSVDDANAAQRIAQALAVAKRNLSISNVALM